MPPKLHISAAARRLLRVLEDNAEGELTIEELAREVRASKTAVGHALRELEDVGAIAMYEAQGEEE